MNRLVNKPFLTFIAFFISAAGDPPRRDEQNRVDDLNQTAQEIFTSTFYSTQRPRDIPRCFQFSRVRINLSSARTGFGYRREKK